MPQAHNFRPDPKHGGLTCSDCGKGRANVMHMGLPDADDNEEGGEQAEEQPAPTITRVKPKPRGRQPARQAPPPPPEPEIPEVLGTSITDDPDVLSDLIERGVSIADALPQDSPTREAILTRCAQLWLYLVE